MSYTIVITEKGGKPREEAFDQNEITIGRVQGNDIVLAKGNISKKHSRIVLRDGKFIIVDLKSTNGTYVNGKRISSPQVLKDSDKIYIGDFTLTLDGAQGEDAEKSGEPRAEDEDLFAEESGAGPGNAEADADASVPPSNGKSPATPGAARQGGLAQKLGTPAAMPSPQLEGGRAADERGKAPAAPPPRRKETRPALHDFKIDLPPAPALQARAAVFSSVTKALTTDGALPPDDEATLEKARAAADKTLATLLKKVGASGEGVDNWPAQIAREICGMGPLADLIEDQNVVEIFVNGPHQILVRRSPDTSSVGVPLMPVQTCFSSDEAVALVVRRIMHTVGVRFDAEHPIAEGRLADGSRVNAVHHAVSLRGPLVTISRNSTRSATLDELVSEHVLSKNMAEFLELCVRSRRNVCVCGGPGTPVGTLLSALANVINDGERIVVVEQIARLQLRQPHVVTLEPRPLRGGPAAATLRDLVGNALRMRPGRVVAHEVTGVDAHERFGAMGGRQDGTLFTTYAATTRDCLDRLEMMISMAGLDVQSRVVREQIATSLDIIVTVTRFADGTARVTQISEVTGVEVDLVTTQDLFTFRREGFDENGAVIGRFQATGTPPRFYDQLQRRGDSVNLAIFRD